MNTKISKDCEEKIERAKAELKELNEQDSEELDIEGLATLAASNLKKLSQVYSETDSDIQRAITGSIFLEKWVFDGENHRTTKRHKKTGANFIEKIDSGKALPFELNSNKFIDDLKKIARISGLVTQEPLNRDFALKYRRTWKKKIG